MCRKVWLCAYAVLCVRVCIWKVPTGRVSLSGLLNNSTVHFWADARPGCSVEFSVVFCSLLRSVCFRCYILACLRLFFFHVHAIVFTVYSLVVLRVVYITLERRVVVLSIPMLLQTRNIRAVFFFCLLRKESATLTSNCAVSCVQRMISCWRVGSYVFFFPDNWVSLTHQSPRRFAKPNMDESRRRTKCAIWREVGAVCVLIVSRSLL